MTIKLAEHYGLCFGVRDALAQAEQLAQTQPLTILGQLAHNPAVRARLVRAGAAEGDLADLQSAKTEQVMITAHGASDRDRERWAAAGHQVQDGTCPLVRKAHDTLRALVREGYAPVIIGEHGHVEVRGLSGDFPSALVVATESDLADVPAAPRYGVISQTTQPSAKVEALVAALRRARPGSDVRYCDTICQPTKRRQAALQQLLAEVEMVVVVGGRQSNNTRELVKAVEAAGRRVRQVENAGELRLEWFAGVSTIGLTAGTSTLPEQVAAVEVRLREITEELVEPTASTSSAQWVEHFRRNAEHQRTVSWSAGVGASSEELREILPSLRAWQLGETSDGSHLLAAARRYAEEERDASFVEAVRLFIQEEQRHGETLGRFLDLAGVARARKDWGDSLFRTCRYALRSMEAWVTPVLMVEIHALVFYRALLRATGSEVLRAICSQILADEVAHIRFQVERLAILHARHSGVRRRLTMGLHRLFFALISTLIWFGHRRAFRAGGYTWRSYSGAAWGRMHYAWRQIAAGTAELVESAAQSAEPDASTRPKGSWVEAGTRLR